MEGTFFDASKDFVKSNLLEGEEVLYSAGLHWYIFLRPIFQLLLSIIVPGIFFSIFRDVFFYMTILRVFVTTVWIFAAVIYLVYVILVYRTTEIYVTDKRVAWKRGIIGRATLDISVSMIESVLFKQSILERIFNCGHIYITGVGAIISKFHGIYNPLEFRNIIIKKIV